MDYWLQRWSTGRTFSERKDTVLELAAVGSNSSRRRLRDLFINRYWRKSGFRVTGGRHIEWYGPTDEKVLVKSFTIDAKPVTNEEYWTFLKLSGYVSPLGENAFWFLEEMLGEMPSDLRKLWNEDPNKARKTASFYVDAPFEYGCFEDNKAFTEWVGMRMPTQPEWEMACESGLRFGKSDVLPGFFCVRSPATRNDE
jgi:hypothetical protein